MTEFDRPRAIRELVLHDRVIRVKINVLAVPLPEGDDDEWDNFCHVMDWHPLGSARRAYAPDLGEYIRGAAYAIFDDSNLVPGDSYFPSPSGIAYAEEVELPYETELPVWFAGTPRG